MQKLFTLLRQGNFDEFKKIITNKPELLNSVSGPKPKKDHGHSLLQVAFKTGKLDIADFLIESGIDINFMEAEDDDSGVRAPVLFDAITAVLMSLCVNKYSSKEQRKWDAPYMKSTALWRCRMKCICHSGAESGQVSNFIQKT